jgi:hypothetical protein
MISTFSPIFISQASGTTYSSQSGGYTGNVSSHTRQPMKSMSMISVMVCLLSRHVASSSALPTEKRLFRNCANADCGFVGEVMEETRGPKSRSPKCSTQRHQGQSKKHGELIERTLCASQLCVRNRRLILHGCGFGVNPDLSSEPALAS